MLIVIWSFEKKREREKERFVHNSESPCAQGSKESVQPKVLLAVGLCLW